MKTTRANDLDPGPRRPERTAWPEEPSRPEDMRVAVVGGGIAGLVLAHDLQRAAAVDVFEAAPVPGGHAVTLREHGFTVEGGPVAFVDGRGRLRRLARELGLEEDLLAAPPAARRRLVVSEGRLHPIPHSLGSLLASHLLTPAGKLRLLVEPFLRRRSGRVEETIDEFACRRVGREAAEVVDAAIAGGVSAGDVRALSLPAAFPRLAGVERHRDRLLEGLFGRAHALPGETGLLAFRDGMGQLVQALARALGPRLHTSAGVERLVPETPGDAWRVVLADGTSHLADRVALTVSSRDAGRLLGPVDPELAGLLSAQPFASVAVVALAYRSRDLPEPLPGYGYVTLRRERMATLAVTFESSIFPHRAPAGFVLVRVLLGGTRRPEVVNAPEALRIDLARRELARVLDVTAPPAHAWSFAWPDAIPQYVPRHRESVAQARMQVTRRPGIVLCGTSYEGISLDAAVDGAHAHADAILAGAE